MCEKVGYIKLVMKGLNSRFRVVIVDEGVFNLLESICCVWS